MDHALGRLWRFPPTRDRSALDCRSDCRADAGDASTCNYMFLRLPVTGYQLGKAASVPRTRFFLDDFSARGNARPRLGSPPSSLARLAALIEPDRNGCRYMPSFEVSFANTGAQTSRRRRSGKFALRIAAYVGATFSGSSRNFKQTEFYREQLPKLGMSFSIHINDHQSLIVGRTHRQDDAPSWLELLQ